jgi:hypothetical protein
MEVIGHLHATLGKTPALSELINTSYQRRAGRFGEAKNRLSG